MIRLNPLNRIQSALATLLTALIVRFYPPVAGARSRQQYPAGHRRAAHGGSSSCS